VEWLLQRSGGERVCRGEPEWQTAGLYLAAYRAPEERAGAHAMSSGQITAMARLPSRPLPLLHKDLLDLEKNQSPESPMKYSILSLQRWLGAWLMCLVAACGGGGANGPGAGAVGPGISPSATADASILLKSEATITDVTYEGQPLHQAHLDLAVEGNLASLQRGTLYLVLVDPSRTFLPSDIFIPADSASAWVTLNGTASSETVPGRRSGKLQLFACVDPACATQLRNSPLEVGYDIEVLPGITLSTDLLDVRTNYGDVPSPASMTITVPAGGNRHIPNPIGDVEGADSTSSWANLPLWVQRTTDTLTLQPPAGVLPGVYALHYEVDTVVPDPRYPKTVQRLVKTFVVRHTVMATGVYSMSPSSENIEASGLTPLGPQPSTTPVQLVSQVGGTVARRGVRTDSFPAAATGDPLLASWLAFDAVSVVSSLDHAIRACDVATNRCLPVGTYRGALLMRHTAPDGTQTDFEFPVTFTINP
jgi:hypothetical protein